MVERLSYVSHDSSISRDPSPANSISPSSVLHVSSGHAPDGHQNPPFSPRSFSAHTSAPPRFLAHPQPNSKGEDFAGEVVFFWSRAYTLLIQMVAIVI